ncbi:T9SS type A sorting domain-containing protein [uncultured Kordia sp.]|uniref:T9SS type A sorting domain-containing protein n=1 Tax=uncultured Kordia sp. TaxID=507699 RepID=UPI00261EF04E|nr:T9SS type A sorting domain-containing protein [uncultured Kordia sp.]
MKHIYILFLVLFASYSLKAQDDPDLLGQWYLHYIESNGATIYVPNGNALTITFSNLDPNPFAENVVGFGTCNEFFGKYELNNGNTSLDIVDLSQTLVMCDGDTFESVYFSILGNSSTNFFDYTINLTDETLTMIDLLGEKLVYGRQILSTKDNKSFSSNIKIYPNPVQEKFSITGISTNSKTSYSIHNLVGSVIISERSMTQASLDVSQLKAGIYFIKFQQQGKTAVKKFVKI